MNLTLKLMPRRKKIENQVFQISYNYFFGDERQSTPHLKINPFNPLQHSSPSICSKNFESPPLHTFTDTHPLL